MTDREIAIAAERSGVTDLADWIDPDRVDTAVNLARNRLFARRFLSEPGPRWQLTRDEVEAELRKMGHNPADFKAELDVAFVLGCLCYCAPASAAAAG